jgi:hypothetical protein
MVSDQANVLYEARRILERVEAKFAGKLDRAVENGALNAAAFRDELVGMLREGLTGIETEVGALRAGLTPVRLSSVSWRVERRGACESGPRGSRLAAMIDSSCSSFHSATPTRRLTRRRRSPKLPTTR